MKALIIYFQYRDGANYKSPGEAHFENDLAKCTPEDVEKAMNNAGIPLDEPIIFDYYGLHDFGFEQLSPIENEFSQGGMYDHPYQEILFVSDMDEQEGPFDHKISDFLEHLMNITPEQIKVKREQAAKDAGKVYAKTLDALEHFIETGDDSRLDTL